MTVGKYAGENVVFVTRHGAGHKVLPTEVPFKANIFAVKQMGVRYMFAVSACGSLREGVHPGDLVLIDQFIDRTKAREATFFGKGVVGMPTNTTQTTHTTPPHHHRPHLLRSPRLQEVYHPRRDCRHRVPEGRDRAQEGDLRVHGGAVLLDPG